jgi:hypothetical protein
MRALESHGDPRYRRADFTVIGMTTCGAVIGVGTKGFEP